MRSVLVTGGAVRLGKAIADRLRAEGWRVITSSHRADAGADIVADLAEPMGAAKLYAAALQILGGTPPDALVNNAALFTGDDAAITAINLEAPKKLTMLMAGRETGVGAVVNVLDAKALDGDRQPASAADGYRSSKRELAAFTRSSAATFAATLRVNGVAPGPVMAPTGVHVKAGERLLDRRPTADDVAAAVSYLLDAESVTGAIIPVDAGQHLLHPAPCTPHPAPRTLLHTCCGPCASACVPRLKEMGREVTMLFANSNIDTKEEFDKRLREAEKLAAVDGVKIVALPYDHGEWLREVAAGHEHEPEKGARCERCFRYNLAKAAEYAKAHGFDEFTTSLTVSPHKVSAMIFSASDEPMFLKTDFKKKEGFKLSVQRAEELGLYRQSYCGCEFSKWNVHHKTETVSTNLDARAGRHRDVFTADYQTAGRGRLDHKWLSPPGTNLMMSVVLSAEGLVPEQVTTLPLVAGLAVTKAIAQFIVRKQGFGRETQDVRMKWPNDVLVGGKKIAGILCERCGDNVLVGIGVNVGQTEFDKEIADRATSLALVADISRFSSPVLSVRTAILCELDRWYSRWCAEGFAAVHPELAEIDALRGCTVSVRQTDADAAPIVGSCGGIQADGTLDIGGMKVYAGEAHVESSRSGDGR